MKIRIAVIVIYFGKLPPYFPLWVKSCAYNPDVDFLFFTDCALSNLPQNVFQYQMTLEELKKRASGIVGFEVSMGTAYKVCDYRPMFGELFQDYLTEYEYWGHCDIDLIFGDLQYFFDKYDLRQYDRFNALGHLSLYRNDKEINRRYRREGGLDYREVFTTEKHCYFEEYQGMTAIYLKNQFPFFTGQIYADVSSIYKRYRIVDIYKLDEKAKNYPNQVFFWEDGKCYRSYYDENQLRSEEYLYIHFKQRGDLPMEKNVQDSTAFYITRFGFFKKEGEPTRKLMQKYNPYQGKLVEKYEWYLYLSRRLVSRGKRKIKGLLSLVGE